MQFLVKKNGEDSQFFFILAFNDAGSIEIAAAFFTETEIPLKRIKLPRLAMMGRNVASSLSSFIEAFITGLSWRKHAPKRPELSLLIKSFAVENTRLFSNPPEVRCCLRRSPQECRGSRNDDISLFHVHRSMILPVQSRGGSNPLLSVMFQALRSLYL